MKIKNQNSLFTNLLTEKRSIFFNAPDVSKQPEEESYDTISREPTVGEKVGSRIDSAIATCESYKEAADQAVDQAIQKGKEAGSFWNKMFDVDSALQQYQSLFKQGKEKLTTTVASAKADLDQAVQGTIGEIDQNLYQPTKETIASVPGKAKQMVADASDAVFDNEDIQGTMAEIDNNLVKPTVDVAHAVGEKAADTYQAVADTYQGAKIKVAEMRELGKRQREGTMTADTVTDEVDTKKPKVVRIEKGDSLWKIAQREGYKTTQENFSAIVATNNLSNERDIHPGQKIIIPNSLDRA